MPPLWIGCPSSNFRRGRPFGCRPEAIVIHCMDGSFAAGESVISDPTTQKSAHYGVSKEGVVHQYVDENDTAFHAGIVVNPTWELLKPNVNPNLYTIGIEHEALAKELWTPAQLAASTDLVLQIAARWGIPLDPKHVIRHNEIRASKSCPGGLDVNRLLASIPDSKAAAPPPTIATVHIVRNVNVRKERPNTMSPIDRVLTVDSQLSVVGFIVGERVSNNAYWYADSQGNYIWAGATDVPFPSPAA